MRIRTIHRNKLGDVYNECSAQGFQITTADGGRITIMVDGDGLARAEPPSAPAAVAGFDEWYDSVDARFWDNRDACNAAFHAGKRAALTQHQETPSNARGEWVLVPRVPTEAMISHGEEWEYSTISNGPAMARQLYAAMLAAAPSPVAAPQQPAAVAVDKPIPETVLDRACDAYEQIADDCMGLVRRKAMRAALTVALGDARRLVERLAAHVRPTCSELWDEAQAFLEAEGVQAGDGCHCATCTCEPNMTPAVRFDLSPAQQEGAIREHLIRLGWAPPTVYWGLKTCYQCNRPVTWLAPDSRCVDCTRLTPDEVGG